jgi:hypothetical protein
MRGLGGYRFLVILLFVLAFFVVSSGISYTGGMVGGPEESLSGIPVYTCPENECPEGEGMKETIEECRDVLKKYEEMAEELEAEKQALMERMELLLGEQCETGGPAVDVEKLVDPERVRNFAVFIVSNSGKDPVTSLYDYVRTNVKFVEDPGNEYAAKPCETIISGGGDCEDQAVLLASLLEAVGVDSFVMQIPGEHTFVGIAEEDVTAGVCENPLRFQSKGKKLIVADTTFSNCIGSISGDYAVLSEGGWEWKIKPVVFDV